MLHMLQHRYDALSATISASEHTPSIRTLPLILSSGLNNYDIRVPVFAKYDRASKVFITVTITYNEWDTLCGFVRDEPGLKVILSPDGGRTDFLARLYVAGEREMEIQEVGAEVEVTRLNPRKGEVRRRLRKGMAWFEDIL